MSGAVILVGRDGCYRDLASMHGSYRKVAETQPALERIGRLLQRHAEGSCCWFLDRPVSNSGRLAQLIVDMATQHGWDWTTQLEYDVDGILSRSPHAIATADGVILDHLGDAYHKAGQTAKALETWRKAVQALGSQDQAEDITRIETKIRQHDKP